MNRRKAIVALVTTSLLLACSGSDKTTRDTSDIRNTGFKVALLTPGPISDNSWNGSAYQGLLSIRDSLGAEISHIQTRTPAEFEENFRQYGAQGYSLVIGNGFEFQDAALRVAPNYPNTIYVVTSGLITGPNVSGATFLFEEASYEAGIVAGAVTKSNQIGLIAGTDLPTVKSSFEAFIRGVKVSNPEARTFVTYIGNWEDASAGKEQALALIARGVDVIFQNADAAGLGVFQAVKEKRIFAIGSNSNQNSIAPDNILASVVIDLPTAFLDLARLVKENKFTGQLVEFGVKDSVVRLEYNESLKSNIPAKALAQVDSVDAQLHAGTFSAIADITKRTTTPQSSGK